MNTQKGLAPILIILLGFVLIGGGVYVYDQKNDLGIFGTKENIETSVPDEENTKADSSEEKDIVDTSTASKDKGASNKIETNTSTAGKIDSKIITNNTPVTDSTVNATTDLWSIFDQVTLALKNKDIVSYNKFSYRQVTPEESSQFSDFVPFLLEMSLGVNKGEYINKWQDDKQAIYSTPPKRDNKTDYYGYTQGFVKFIKKDGVWKLLSTGDSSWGVTAITTVDGTNRTQTEADITLKEMMLDSDKDGLSDMSEKCEGSKIGDKSCVKTDPNKRDTDGDDWWDGIDESMDDF
jgi:hypothetical protein